MIVFCYLGTGATFSIESLFNELRERCLLFLPLLLNLQRYLALKPLMPKLRGDKPPFRLPMIAQCKIIFI